MALIKERELHLDGLRAIAFLLVFISHSPHFFLKPETPHYLKIFYKIYNTLADFGWVGVDLFFCLSAYLVTSILLAEEVKTGKINWHKFQLRRILRIWPLYFLTVAIGFYTILATDIYPGITESSLWKLALYLSTFTMNLAIVHGLCGGLPAIIAPIWSVGMEQQFYLVWGTILRVVKHKTVRIVILSLALVGSIIYRAKLMQISPAGAHYIFYLDTFARLDSIVFGACAAIYFSKESQASSIRGKWLFALCITLFTATLMTSPNILTNRNTFSYLILDFCCLLALLSSFKYAPLRALLSTRALGLIGRVSYPMYLMHPLIIILSPKIFPLEVFNLQGPVFATLVFIPLFILGLILHFLIEKPVAKFKTKLTM